MSYSRCVVFALDVFIDAIETKIPPKFQDSKFLTSDIFYILFICRHLKANLMY